MHHRSLNRSAFNGGINLYLPPGKYPYDEKPKIHLSAAPIAGNDDHPGDAAST